MPTEEQRVHLNHHSLLPFTLLHKILQTFSSPFSFFQGNAPYCPILEKRDKAEMMAWLFYSFSGRNSAFSITIRPLIVVNKHTLLNIPYYVWNLWHWNPAASAALHGGKSLRFCPNSTVYLLNSHLEFIICQEDDYLPHKSYLPYKSHRLNAMF